MRHTESIDSTEVLKQAVQLMRRHGTSMHPVHYAIWYEYARGENLDLRNAIDRYLSQHLHLDDAVAEALHKRHVVGSGTDPAMLRRMSDSVSSVLGQIADSAARAGDQTAAYGSSLSRFQDGLNGREPLPGLEEIVAVGDTGTTKPRATHPRPFAPGLVEISDRLAAVDEEELPLLRFMS